MEIFVKWNGSRVLKITNLELDRGTRKNHDNFS